MSWGVATQNGVSVSLASIVSLSAGVTEFSPADLFTGGVQGAWYDPSDYSTLFQDSAGTTPVTAVEQPVGLMLDKSQGLALSAELVPDYDFATPASWTPETADWVVSGGKATYTKPGAGVQYLQSNDNISIVSGTWYKLTFTISGIASGSAIFGLFNKTASTNYLGAYQTITANGTYSIYFLATSSTTGIRIYGNAGGTATSWSFESFGIKSLAGNHASQATAASRPVLRARYNLLTYSEQFDNAAWTKSQTTISANAVTAPDGTTTADSLIEDNTLNSHRVQQAATTIAGAVYTLSTYIKKNTRSWVALYASGANVGRFFNVDAGTTGGTLVGAPTTSTITAVGNGWYRCEISFTATASTTYQIYLATGDGVNTYTGDGTSGLYIWGAQLVTGSSAGTYQRIAAATDYATAGFLPYLAFDGTDDSFGTNSINFSATDKMFVCTGITKLSDAATGTVIDQNGVVGTAAFMLRAPSGAFANYAFFSAGTLGFSGAIATTYTAPITNVVSAIGNISGDQEIVRVNGAQAAINTGDQGTGNYSNLPIYIGRRQGAALPFNGRIYQMVVCGKALSASELASTEAYVNSKTGAY